MDPTKRSLHVMIVETYTFLQVISIFSIPRERDRDAYL